MKCFPLFLFSAWAFLLGSCARTPSLPPGQRPAHWAQPVPLSGVPNLYRVSDDLYRSGQPTTEGMVQLALQGVRTVITLRFFSDDVDEVGSLPLEVKTLRTRTWAPSDDLDDRFLELVRTSPKPVLIHCLHGSDRTGALCARFRIEEEGWSVDEAIAEMTQGGFGFHCIWKDLPIWVREQSQKAP